MREISRSPSAIPSAQAGRRPIFSSSISLVRGWIFPLARSGVIGNKEQHEIADTDHIAVLQLLFLSASCSLAAVIFLIYVGAVAAVQIPVIIAVSPPGDFPVSSGNHLGVQRQICLHAHVLSPDQGMFAQGIFPERYVHFLSHRAGRRLGGSRFSYRFIHHIFPLFFTCPYYRPPDGDFATGEMKGEKKVWHSANKDLSFIVVYDMIFSLQTDVLSDKRHFRRRLPPYTNEYGAFACFFYFAYIFICIFFTDAAVCSIMKGGMQSVNHEKKFK